jgi:hypothetical protein
MLKKYNDKLKIKHITLTDNSTKFCDSIKDGIKLSLMLTLLTGHTWFKNECIAFIFMSNKKKIIL